MALWKRFAKVYMQEEFLLVSKNSPTSFLNVFVQQHKFLRNARRKL